MLSILYLSNLLRELVHKKLTRKVCVVLGRDMLSKLRAALFSSTRALDIRVYAVFPR